MIHSKNKIDILCEHPSKYLKSKENNRIQSDSQKTKQIISLITLIKSP